MRIIISLWACNDKIARQNAERFEHMDLRNNLTPALLAYDGIQYTYMAPEQIKDFNWSGYHFDEDCSSDQEYIFTLCILLCRGCFLCVEKTNCVVAR